MKSILCFSILFLVLAATAVAQTPSVPANAILNSASDALVGLPNSSIAQGSIFSIYGSNLGPASSPGLAYPLQTTLGGVSVKVTSGGTTVNAIPLYVGPSQINAILPSNTPTGAANLTVTYNNATSASAAFQVISSSVGIFAVNQQGSGPGVITDSNNNAYSLNAAANPGDVAIIWATGLGPVQGNEAGGPLPGDMPNLPVKVYVGPTQAAVNYRGRSGCCAGLDQIVFVVPQGVAGCHVPVVVQTGDIVSNFVTFPAAASGRVCSDPTGPSSTDLSKYLTQGSVSLGSVGLTRVTNTSPGLPPPLGTGQPTTTTTDSGSASFEKYTALQLNSALNPFQTYTLGACVVNTFTGMSAVVTDPVKAVGLDAGNAIGVNGPNGAKQLTMTAGGSKGFYSASLGGGSGPSAAPLYLSAGSYTITGPGGADVVSFSQNVNVPQPLVWTNESSIDTVVRANGQDVTWTGGDPGGTVSITGLSFKLGSNPNGSDAVGGFFVCTAPVSAGHFTVFPPVLLSLPQSSSIQVAPGISISFSQLSVGTGSRTNITPPPATLDIATINSSVSSGKTVTYQ